MKKTRQENSTKRQIAHHLTVAKCAHGVPKPKAKSNLPKMIHSIGTERTYRASIELFINWRSELGLDLSGPYLCSEMQEFLFECGDIYQQKQVNTIQQSLQVVFAVSLTKVNSELPTNLVTRAYESKKSEAVFSRQSPRNQLSARLCLSCGLRAHELFTIVRYDGIEKPSGHRTWRTDLHTHREEVKLYVVTGKGGLKRSVAIPIQLAAELEKTLRPAPVEVFDREIKYENCFYDLAGGQALSQSFTNASRSALGWSSGLHGLRHSFAQRRLREIRAAGVATNGALQIVSQELGHFRPSITLVYLR